MIAWNEDKQSLEFTDDISPYIEIGTLYGEAYIKRMQSENNILREALVIYANREEQEGFFGSVAHKALQRAGGGE